MSKAVLITGGNVGDVIHTLGRALDLISSHAGTIIKVSGIHSSEPWGDFLDTSGNVNDRTFYNQVIEIDTPLDPHRLLQALKQIEKELGRNMTPDAGDGKRLYEDRSIDIDILYFDDLVLVDRELTVPHPLMDRREFVLVPLAEILPDRRHPVSGLSSVEMLGNLRNKAE